VNAITDKTTLVAALHDAANLEHQLMVQYLYAGFSLKRDPGPGCTPAQYEAVRRWSSTIFMVARQEMEHLSLANSMLTSIGEPVHFARTNIGAMGLQSVYFHADTLARTTDPGDPEPVSLPYAFERFDMATIERFICGESPPYRDLPPNADPAWCFTCGGGALLTGAAAAQEVPLEPSHLAAVAAPRAGAVAAVAGANQPGFQAGSVQELYLAIRNAFEELPGLFVADPPEVEIPVEYNVYAFAVTDRATAVAAVDLILEQGEGLGDPWNLDAHFRRFYDIREELVALTAADPSFAPSYPLLTNPRREQITDDLAREVFDVCNDAYVMMLLILTSLYEHAVPAADDAYPFLATALSQNAFAPMMTMIVRALNEVLVLLPVDEGGDLRTGPNFHISDADQALLSDPRDAFFGDIARLLGRWDEMSGAIERVAAHAERSGPKHIAAALRYVHHSAHRTGANLRQTYQSGLYAKFVSVNP
jgi:hypothetical protein